MIGHTTRLEILEAVVDWEEMESTRSKLPNVSGLSEKLGIDHDILKNYINQLANEGYLHRKLGGTVAPTTKAKAFVKQHQDE